jgi:sugar phosphate isomerase/epimerase
MNPCSRRRFLEVSTLTFGSLLAGRPAAARPVPAMLRLGGPVFLKTEDPVLLAREHRRLEYGAAYAPHVSINDRPRIEAIRKAFATENVVLAEVGAWVNMLDADPVKRNQNLQYVTERLALADELGALACVNIAGSFNPRQWDGPDPRNVTNLLFEATVENCQKIIDAVKPSKARFCLEMMGWSYPDGPDVYLRLIRAIDRPGGFGVHVDMANLINSPDRYYNNAALTKETFRKLGRWVVSAHAKDIAGKDGHLAETIPGRGGLDYATYLREVTSLGREVPLMLEHLRTPEEYDEARQYVMQKAIEVGIPLA